MKANTFTPGFKRPILAGIIVFVIVASLTQYLSYQRYIISKVAKQDDIVREVNLIERRLKSSLTYSLSATKTLAFLVEEYGVPRDFKKVAQGILEDNKYIDALELTNAGVITHIYPLEGNEAAVGFNVLSDSIMNKEAYRAIEKRALFFAGPLELRQGGLAVVGRLPIFKKNKFLGFSVVLIKLSTLLKAAGIDTFQNNYIYQLSKINPVTLKEEFFLPPYVFPSDGEKSASIKVPDGEWNLYVMHKSNDNIFNIISLSFFGILLSVTGGVFAWHLLKQPEKLNSLVKEKTFQLVASEKYFRSLIEKSADAIVLIDSSGKVLYQSPSTERISGYRLDEAQGLDGKGHFHPDEREEDRREFFLLVGSPGTSLIRKHRLKHKKGHYIWVEGTYTNLLNDENVRAIVFNYYEITERVRSEQKVAMAVRLYQVISKINQVMITVADEHALFKEACNIAVDLGKFRMAWIGMIDETGTKVIPQVYAGEEQDFLSKIKYNSLENIQQSTLPTGIAFRTGFYQLCNDIENSSMMKEWATEALVRGYRSSIALPIKKFGNVVGIFNLYASIPDFFDQNEIDLLEETTGNISFTLENFERDKMRKEVEEEVASEKFLSESIINSLPGIFFLYDRNGKILRWNKNHETVYGYSTEETALMHMTDFIDPEEKKILKEKVDGVFNEGNADLTTNLHTKDGRKIPYYLNGRKVNLNGTDYLLGMGIDISDRVASENELLARNKEIQKLTAYMERIQEEERTRIAREIHDELGQQLTGLKIDACYIEKKINPADSRSHEKISGMIVLIDETIQTVRRIASELRPGILDDLGLTAAIEWQGEEFEKRTGIKSDFYSNLSDFNPDGNLSTNIFRVYQEALTNITRHAKASLVDTTLEVTDQYISLTIKDNGSGFDIDEVRSRNSLGLIGMKERALLFNGELAIISSVGNGTVINLKIPLIDLNKPEV